MFSNRISEKPVLALSLLSEIAQAISQLNPDRALLFLTESAVSITESEGAMLMIPHEKNNLMVPFVKSFQKKVCEPQINEDFQKFCYEKFLTINESSSESKLVELDWELGPENEIAYGESVFLAGKPVAMLVFSMKPGFSLTGEQQSFLSILTPFMGSLMENFRLNNEMIHKNSRLSALYEISQQAESLIDFRDVYDSLGKVARSFINYDAYLLYLLGTDGKTLEARVAIGEAEAFEKKIRVGEGPVGHAAAQLKPYLTFTTDYNSVLILPIEVSGKLIGVLTIASKKAYAYRDEDIIGLRIIATQIASIDHMFKDLIQLKGFTERILESMTSGVIIFDRSGKVTFSNHEVRRLLLKHLPEGWSPLEDTDGIPADLIKLMLEVLESNLTLENERLRLNTGASKKIVEVNAFPFRTEKGGMLGTAFFIKDITQLTAMEDQLKRADRLSALGVLAAGIAHEIRNPLTGMKMIVQLLESEFAVEDSRREPLGIIQKEIDRLEGIIGNLLDFARPSKPKALLVYPCDVIDACYQLVKNQLNKLGIKFRKGEGDDCPAIIADPDQLKQVFLNILTNAIHALNRGGELSVGTIEQDGYVVALFRDNGIGIPTDKLQDIFNPFMTTKEDGTGLGLSMAQRIVEEHGGRIEVESQQGVGSLFKVFLPLKRE